MARSSRRQRILSRVSLQAQAVQSTGTHTSVSEREMTLKEQLEAAGERPLTKDEIEDLFGDVPTDDEG